MNKFKLAAIIAILNLSFSIAGGILTNTNQTAHFARNPARDASTEIDAVYTNPAGLIKLAPGFHFSINSQSAFQTRTITSTYPLFAGFGGNQTKEFEGKASAPIVPSIFAVYRIGDWAISGNIAVTGGGGKATFNNGLPSFESGISLLPSLVNGVLGLEGENAANQYSLDAYMKGSSFIYGAQLGGTYKINDMFSAYGGFRLNIVNNGYEGHLRDLKTNPTLPAYGFNGGMVSVEPILDMAIAATTDEEQRKKLELLKKASGENGARLDCSQSGWGVTPILGVNFSYEKLNVGIKYEFKSKLNVENKTKIDDTGLFQDGVNTPHDIPALLTIGASYKIVPQLTVSAGYHHFFDSDAKMDGDKQKHINGGTDEYLAGIEYQIDRLFMISGGFQLTRYGVKDEYQRDLSFSLNSYTIGFGGAVNVTPTVKINIGYFWTTYSDYTKCIANYANTDPAIPGTDVFSRTNKTFAAGVDFSF